MNITLTHDSAEMTRSLRNIKILHTAVWAVMAGSILSLPWFAWFGKFRWVLGLTLLVIGECLVLALNGGRCPLTDVAARFTNDHACNFDIYLPLWLACNNKVVFGFLFIVGEAIVLWRWVGRPAI